MKELFKDYINPIRSALEPTNDLIKSNNYSGINGWNNAFEIEKHLTESNKSELLPSLNTFAKGLSLEVDFEQRLGAHPDFEHLKQSDSIEKHFIVSMFIDIKGSTNLFKRYDPETVFLVSNMIHKTAIHICLLFGGYVHRLQGDGLFVYFGGKKCNEEQAVKQALKASSLFLFFVKEVLSENLNQLDVEPIYTRIGIDLGEANDVVWGLAGIGNISEITTCSLHTSLASKMQSNAEDNGVVLGHNLKEYLLDDYVDVVSKRTGKESDRYVFEIPEKKFRYTQYDFNWLYYLKNQSFVATNQNGSISLKSTNTDRDIGNLGLIAKQNKPYLEL